MQGVYGSVLLVQWNQPIWMGKQKKAYELEIYRGPSPWPFQMLYIHWPNIKAKTHVLKWSLNII